MRTGLRHQYPVGRSRRVSYSVQKKDNRGGLQQTVNYSDFIAGYHMEHQRLTADTGSNSSFSGAERKSAVRSRRRQFPAADGTCLWAWLEYAAVTHRPRRRLRPVVAGNEPRMMIDTGTWPVCR